MLAATPPAALAGKTELVSVSSTGVQADGKNSHPAVSGNGAVVAFEAGADSGRFNVYRKDRTTGTFRLVNVTPAGEPSAGEAHLPAMSADGNIVAFSATAPDLVPGGGPAGRLVPYLRDMTAGKTTRLAITADGSDPDGDVYVGGISGDGRFVLLQTYATNILPGDTNLSYDALAHDRLTGKTALASARANGGFARKGGAGSLPSISLDGRWVAFDSDAATLVSGDNNRAADIFVRKLPAPSVP